MEYFTCSGYLKTFSSDTTIPTYSHLKNRSYSILVKLAGILGVEPRLRVSKTPVLSLQHIPIKFHAAIIIIDVIKRTTAYVKIILIIG